MAANKKPTARAVLSQPAGQSRFTPGHPENKPGFVAPQLASAPRSLEGADLGDRFASEVAPGLLGPVVPIPGAAVPFDITSLVGCVQIGQITMPAPMPVLVTLECRLAENNFLGGAVPLFGSGVVALPAELYAAPGQPPAIRLSGRGRFIVQWGTGSATYYVMTDLDYGSLQIPSALFVRVYAHVFGDDGFIEPGLITLAGTAQFRPGIINAGARAHYTINLFSDAASSVAGVASSPIVPPYARTLSMACQNTPTEVDPIGTRATLRALLRRFNGPAGQLLAVAPGLTPDVGSNLQITRFPFGADSMILRLNADPGSDCGGTAVLEIEL